jgi:hypothetical protein
MLLPPPKACVGANGDSCRFNAQVGIDTALLKCSYLGKWAFLSLSWNARYCFCGSEARDADGQSKSTIQARQSRNPADLDNNQPFSPIEPTTDGNAVHKLQDHLDTCLCKTCLCKQCELILRPLTLWKKRTDRVALLAPNLPCRRMQRLWQSIHM